MLKLTCKTIAVVALSGVLNANAMASYHPRHASSVPSSSVLPQEESPTVPLPYPADALYQVACVAKSTALFDTDSFGNLAMEGETSPVPYENLMLAD